jgi:hypothetical protein
MIMFPKPCCLLLLRYNSTIYRTTGRGLKLCWIVSERSQATWLGQHYHHLMQPFLLWFKWNSQNDPKVSTHLYYNFSLSRGCEIAQFFARHTGFQWQPLCLHDLRQLGFIQPGFLSHSPAAAHSLHAVGLVWSYLSTQFAGVGGLAGRLQIAPLEDVTLHEFMQFTFIQPGFLSHSPANAHGSHETLFSMHAIYVAVFFLKNWLLATGSVANKKVALSPLGETRAWKCR